MNRVVSEYVWINPDAYIILLVENTATSTTLRRPR